MHKERLNKVIQYIKENPENHHQAFWTNIDHGEYKVKKTVDGVIDCETQACLAGLASFLYAPKGTVYFRSALKLPGNGARMEYEEWAKDFFELTECEVQVLFHDAQTIDEIDLIVNSEEYYDEQMSKHNCSLL